jgi:hypothetical protein
VNGKDNATELIPSTSDDGLRCPISRLRTPRASEGSVPPLTFNDIVPRISILLCLALLTGCGLTPEKLPSTDPQVQELLRATEAASAKRFGFTPVETSADFRLEKSSGAYDRMLHISGRTNRTIAFRKQAEGFAWIAEQEIFRGPKQYTTVDGTFYEEVCLTYELQRVAHYKLNHLNISYLGEDPRLAYKDDLSYQTIRPLLKEWGYDVEQSGGEGAGQAAPPETSQTATVTGARR